MEAQSSHLTGVRGSRISTQEGLEVVDPGFTECFPYNGDNDRCPLQSLGDFWEGLLDAFPMKLPVHLLWYQIAFEHQLHYLVFSCT